jgi:hypothetical protein
MKIFDNLQIKEGIDNVYLGSYIGGGYGAIYLNQSALSYNNYSVLGTSNNLLLNAPSPTGNITFRTGGNTLLTLDGSTGNFGIGTNTPSGKLDIISDSADGIFIHGIDNILRTRLSHFPGQGGQVALFDPVGLAHTVFNADGSVSYINNTYGFGIGTNNPTSKVSVVSAASDGITIYGTDGLLKTRMYHFPTIGGQISLYDSTGAIKVLFNADGDRSYINNNQNFGLGIDPSAKLHVKGIGSTSSTYSLKIDNSGGSNLLSITDDGSITTPGNLSINGSLASAMMAVYNNNPNGYAAYYSSVANFQAGSASNAVFHTNYGGPSANTVQNALLLRNGSSGTPAPGIGSAIEFLTKNSVTSNFISGYISHSLDTVTAAAEDSRFDFYTVTGGASPSNTLRIVKNMVSINIEPSVLTTFTIRGTGATSSTYAIKTFQVDGTTESFSVTDNGQLNIKDSYWLNGTKILHFGTSNIADSNLFLGRFTGNNTLTGGSNLGISGGLAYLTTGIANIAIGGAGGNTTSGSYNIYIGSSTGATMTTSNGNTLVGFQSLYQITSTTFNTAIGYRAGAKVTNTNSDTNVYIGANSGSADVAGVNCIMLGPYAGQSGTGIFSNSAAFGWASDYTKSNQLVLGSSSGQSRYTEILLGQSNRQVSYDRAAGTTFLVTTGCNFNTAVNGNVDLAGASMRYAAGQSFGIGAPGSLIFAVGTKGTTGATLNTTYTDVITIDGNTANVGINNSTPTEKLDVVGSIKMKGISTGFTGSEIYNKQAGIQTTDATTVSIATIPLAVGEMITLSVMINGFMSDYSTAIGGEVKGTFRRGTTGNVILVGSLNSIINTDSTGSVSFTMDADVSTQTVRIIVTGEATKTYNWVASYSYMKTLTNV